MKANFLILSLLLCFTLTGCARFSSTPHVTYELYHRNTQERHSTLLTSLKISLPVETSPDQDLTSSHIHTLIMGLFSLEDVYRKEALFPSDTKLLSFELLPNGTLNLHFSQEYGELSGIYRTTADYALTLTLTQLSTVTGVRISIFGEDPTVNPPLLRSYDITSANLVH